MRIGIDARVLDRQMTGTGRYLLNILKELPNQDNENEYFLFTNSSTKFDKEFFKIIPYKKSILPEKLFSPIWINVKIPKLVAKHRIDILFMPNVFVPRKKNDNIKYISVVHDTIYKIYKEYYPLSWRIYKSLLLPSTIKNSDLVVTVSKQSKEDLIKFENVPENKIRIVYNTATTDFKPEDKSETEFSQLKEKFSLPDKYLLYVGAIEKRKNVMGAIEILDLVRKKGSELKLVLIGKPGYGSKEIMNHIDKKKEDIKYIRFLDDGDLIKMYKYAFAFLFPSHYEGFGIPPLEAMQCGIPVLASNNSALDEVVGSGGLLHAPNDFVGFANDILRLENDIEFYTQMKTKALEQSKKFDIRHVTRSLIEVFNELR